MESMDEIQKLLERHYAIGPVRAIHALDDPWSIWKKTKKYFLVETASDQFFLKFGTHKIFPRIKREAVALSIINPYMKQVTPSIVKTSEGGLFLQDKNEAVYFLTNFISGKHLLLQNITVDIETEIFCLLASLHHQLKQVDLSKSIYECFPLYAFEKKELIRRTDRLLHTLHNLPTQCHQTKDERDLHQEYISFLQQEIRGTTDTKPLFLQQELQMIHGDYYLNNLIFSENNHIQGVCDWEHSLIGYRVLDLMKAIYFIYLDPQNVHSMVPWDKFIHIFRIYHQINPFTQKELTHVFELDYLRWLNYIDVLEDHYYHGIKKSPILLQQNLNIMKWLKANKSSLDASLKLELEQ